MSAPEEAKPPQSTFTRRRFIGATTALAVGGLTGLSGADPDTNPRLGEPVAPDAYYESIKPVGGELDMAAEGSWGETYGVSEEASGLVVSPTGLEVQDKWNLGFYEPNPQPNLFKRLQVSGNFAIAASIACSAPATVQLYGHLPNRRDDFRHEPARLDCVMERNRLTVWHWDGSGRLPATKHFRYPSEGFGGRLEIVRTEGVLEFRHDNVRIGQQDEDGLFRDGAAWFGLVSEERRAYVSELTARPLWGGEMALVDTNSLQVPKWQRPTIQGEIRDIGSKMLFGSAYSALAALADPRNASLYHGGEIGIGTPEFNLKPAVVQPMRGEFNFASGDADVDLLLRHGLKVNGHAPVYTRVQPRWMDKPFLSYDTKFAKSLARDEIYNHVAPVTNHYRGRISTWDVHNEFMDARPITDFVGEVRFRPNKYYDILGEEYIDIGLIAAHDGDPDSEKYLCDFGIERWQNRANFVFDLCRRLRQRKVPFDGISIQGHWYKGGLFTKYLDAINPSNVADLFARGREDEWNPPLKMRISELDIPYEIGQRRRAEVHAALMRVCLQASNCTALIHWGLNDSNGSRMKLGLVGGPQIYDGLMYDAEYRPKIIRPYILGAIRSAAKRLPPGR